MTPALGSRWVAVAFIGVGLVFGLAAGAVIFFGLPGARWAGAPAAAPLSATATVGAPAPAPVVGAPAPNFSLQTLDGQTVSLADFRGRTVLVNFWATWCGPCEAEMPAIQDRYQTFQTSGLTVLAVNLAEPAADVRAFVERLGLSFTILLDPAETVFDQYRVQGYPTSFFVDPEGVIQNLRIGYMADDQLDHYLQQAGFGSQ